MAYSAALAERIRVRMSDLDGISEKKMFGGLSFLICGKMCVGVVGDDLCARVGKVDFGILSEEPGARPMDFTGRPMKGWLFIDGSAISDDDELQTWINRCHRFVTTL
ncbi:MAG: TfoX/Sxy family transcriptional regulator of competence genes [Myxococcota bacterium]|jgi:TfoX/Sxy family transcriptional regulator of competence genes